MPLSVLEAIQMGYWDYEPQAVQANDYAATRALPGSDEKLAILAERLESGLPLWHPADRLHYQSEDN
ncbi:MAG: hypothetical protein SFX18_18880 [Pirellulales bacterium]|nr:hypothetical protein [Pirellulales bacterium]